MNTIKLSFFVLILLGYTLSNAQNSTRHPLEKYGYKIPVLTMTNGKYYEYFDDDTLVQLGTVLFNTNTSKVAAFVKYDTLFTETGYAPDISSHFISIDPHADRYVSMSPYAFAACNPIRYNDPDGQDPIDLVLGFVDATVSTFSFGLLGNSHNPMVRNTADYQNGRRMGLGFSTAFSLLQGLSGGATPAPEVVPGGTSLVIKTPSVSTIAPVAIVNSQDNKALNNRVKLRKETKEKIKENTPRTEDGRAIDPNTQKPIEEGQEVFGHKPGKEWKKYKKEPANQNKEREEVIKDQNDPTIYQIEDKKSNASHKFEAKPN